MDIVKSIEGIFLSDERRKKRLIERLLDAKQIDAGEAMLLMKSNNIVNLNCKQVSISSGAKVVAGDDNSTESR